MLAYSLISLLEELMSLVVGWFIKCSQWSFRVTNEFLCHSFQSCLIHMPVLWTWYLLCLFLFQCFICFFISCCDGISQKVLVVALSQSVHIVCLVCGSLCVLWCLHFCHIFTQRFLQINFLLCETLILFTILTKSSLNWMKYFTCAGLLSFFKP